MLYIKPKEISEVGIHRIEECVYPPVSLWLRTFQKANFVITDSFHGTVFSIIFQKQFIVLDNPRRGSSRMKSLLNDFSLENRLLFPDTKNEMNLVPINYKNVNDILSAKRKESIDFLKNILNEK